MRKPIQLFASLLFFMLLLSCHERRVAEKTLIPAVEVSVEDVPRPVLDVAKTRGKAKEALIFCQNEGFNTDFCILIDMSLHSGVKRFVVWDFKKDSVDYNFLVGHGCCENAWAYDGSKDSVVFSNKDGSHCTASGKYKIGERGRSDWGIYVKYLLYGLESTNSNALKRTIVLHSWDMITDEELYPNGTAEGWGCPAISNNSLTLLDPLLKASENPVLMWIYK